MNEKNLNAPLRVVTVLWAVAVVLALVPSLTQDQQASQEPSPAPQAEVTAPAETEPVVVGDAEEAGVMYYDRLDVEVLAKILYREARGIPSDTEKACVGWVVCNRVDAGYADTPSEVMTSPQPVRLHRGHPRPPGALRPGRRRAGALESGEDWGD